MAIGNLLVTTNLNLSMGDKMPSPAGSPVGILPDGPVVASPDFSDVLVRTWGCAVAKAAGSVAGGIRTSRR